MDKYSLNYGTYSPRVCKYCKHLIECSASGALIWHDKNGIEQAHGEESYETSCKGSRT